MKLNRETLKDKKTWISQGFHLPQYDVEKVAEQTRKVPTWLYMGAGNIIRAFPAMIMQRVLDAGQANTGLIVAEGFDYEIVEKTYRPHDNLSAVVTLNADGSIDKEIMASIAESLLMDPDYKTDWVRLREIFCAPSLQMVSFTITEKGYSLQDATGKYYPGVQQDFEAGPDAPHSYIGKVSSMLYARYQAGKLPLALVSMDNCSHNGDKLRTAVVAFAKKWSENGRTEKGFYDYVMDPHQVSFPWSMIDKITPRPDPAVQKMLQDCGFEDVDIQMTAKHTYVAPFVNAEKPQYLIIEDIFPNGRPKLELGGVIFTSRETVDKMEKMKVCTCLNPLHTALAIFGCLLGYQQIWKEMQDEDLRKLVEVIGYREGLPVVVDPGIIRPRDFLDEVLQKRVVNPFLPDTPQRIATDTSLKLAIRFGETIKAYQRSNTLKLSDLKLVPLVLAGWCRYLMAVGDDGKPMELSPDPALDTLCPSFTAVKLGAVGNVHTLLQPILCNERIFGVDLYQTDLAQRVEDLFAQMTVGSGAVRATLHSAVEKA